MSNAVRRRPGWRFWGFIAFMLALMTLFTALGTWQVERLGEKERLVAAVAERMGTAPGELPPLGEWGSFDPEAWNYRPVAVAGTWQPEQTVLVFTSLAEPKGARSGPGYWVMTPLALAGGGSILVNRGFVPQEMGPAFAQGGATEPGLVSLAGIARTSEELGGFTPAPDAARRIDWVRNVPRLTTLAGTLPEPVAPIYVDLPARAAGELPQGGETVVSFPNNHLGYAITWYGFALLVPFLLFFWIRRQQGGSRPRP